MEFLPSWPIPVNTLFFFGLLLFWGSLGGFAAHHWRWLPSITGFMLVGFIAGPNVLHLVSHEALAGARIVIDVALGLILYRLGLSLDVKTLAQDRSLVVVSLAESALTFAVVYFVLGLVGITRLPAAIMAALAISSSPAVLIHVSHEMGADGPVTRRASALVAMNNFIAFVVFAALLPLQHAMADAPLATMLGQPLYQLVGSAALGAGVGLVLHQAARKTKAAHQYQLALVVGAVTITLGGALMLNLSTLFAPLVLGLVVRSLEREELVANLEFGPAFELFFIVLFVYAGANLHVDEMLKYAPAALLFVVARSAAKWAGVGVASLATGSPARQAATTGLLLIPMAGLAIGLVNTTVQLFPTDGAVVASVVLAAVAILETIGPPIATRALLWSGDSLTPNGTPTPGPPVTTSAAPSPDLPTEQLHP